MNELETFPNPFPARPYLIQHTADEFTSLCPKTGQPDFGTIEIQYVAAKTCLELKSIKLYLQDYRDRGIFYEAVTNQILEDLVAATDPQWMQVRSRWTVRGGMHSVITCQHGERPENLAEPI